MSELLPCPFCGGEASTYSMETWLVSHACDCLGKYIGTKEHQTEAEAIAAWNTRAAKPCYATDYTHEHCKYSVNRGWVENVAHGTLTAEQVMVIARRHQPDYCSDTHVCFDWQAIADELNAELGSSILYGREQIATLGGELNPDGLPIGLFISEDGELLNWRGENYVKQSTLGECEIVTTDGWLPVERYHRCKICGAFFAVNACPNCGRW